MAFSYDLQQKELIVSIGDFSQKVQTELLSTLDINGFVNNEKKFRELIANNLHELGLSPKLFKKLTTIIKAGQLLPLMRDLEKFGLNFALNTYKFSLDVVPGKADLLKQGEATLAIIGIYKDNSGYFTAFEDENGQYRFAGRIKPFLTREKLYAEPLSESEEIMWVDPRKTKKVKIKHEGIQLLLQETFDISDKVVCLADKKLSATFKNPEAIEFSSEEAPISQLTKRANFVFVCPECLKQEFSYEKNTWEDVYLHMLKEHSGLGLPPIPQDKDTRTIPVKKAQTKFNIDWQLVRVKARDISSPQEKIDFVLAFLTKEPSIHNYGRILNWLKMTRLGYKERSLFDKAIEDLKASKENYSSTLDKETPLAEVSTADLQAVFDDLKSRKYDFQFKSTPKEHTNFMQRLETELQSRTRLASLPLSISTASSEEPTETIGNNTLKVLVASPFESDTWSINVFEGRRVVGRILGSKGAISSYKISETGELTPSTLDNAVATKASELINKYAQWSASTKEEIKKEAHCGPCTPLKMKAIELLSDMHYKFNNFERKFLGQLAAQSEEESNEAFVQTLNTVLDTIKEDEDTKNSLIKLRQIATTLQDVQYRIDDGEFEVVDKPHAHLEKEAIFAPSLGRQPFWDQHADGHTSDYLYPIEVLYPAHTQKPEGSEETDVPEYNDTWNAFTKMDAKSVPAILLKMFDLDPINKEADRDELYLDPYSMARFDSFEVDFEANLVGPDGKDVPCKFTATLLKKGKQSPSFTQKEEFSPSIQEEFDKPFWKEKKIYVPPEKAEGFENPIFWTHVNKKIRSVGPARSISDVGDITYLVTLKEGPFGDKDAGLPPLVVGQFDAREILQYSFRKGKEKETIEKWLINSIESKKKDISAYLRKAAAYEQNPEAREKDMYWKLLLTQQLISNDYESALETAKSSGANTSVLRDIVKKHIQYLCKINRHDTALDLAKKYQVYNPGTKEKPNPFAISEYGDLKYIELAAGNNLPKAPTFSTTNEDYNAAIDFILYGAETPDAIAWTRALKQAERDADKEVGDRKLPEWMETYRGHVKRLIPDADKRAWGKAAYNLRGGGATAKILALKDIPGGKLEEFVKSDSFLTQPWMVQFEAVGSAIALASGKGGPRLDRSLGARILQYISENPALSFTLRKPAFDELIRVHGLGLGKKEQYSVYQKLFNSALEDPDKDVRANAYQAAMEKHLPILPWDNKQKLYYDTADKKSPREIVQREIPEWFINKVRMESDPSLRTSLAKIVEELPKDLITEVKAPIFDKDPGTGRTMLVSPGEYDFKPKSTDPVTGKEETTVTKSVQKLINAVLNNEYASVRNLARTHFGLAPESSEVKTKDVEVKILLHNKAGHWISLGEKAMHQALNNFFTNPSAFDIKDRLERDLDSAQAKSTVDSEKYKQSIMLFKYRIDKFIQLGKALNGMRSSFDSTSSFQNFILWAFKNQGTPLEEMRVPGYHIYGPVISRQDLHFRDLDKLLDTTETIRSNMDSFKARWKQAELPLPTPEPVSQQPPELPLGKSEVVDEDWNMPGFNKEGHLNIESRQPPTTWPLKDPQVGYGAAFPIAPKDDDLLAKDVQQFVGRPRGKWRSYLSELWKILFDNVEEEEIDKKAAAIEPPKNNAEAVALLAGDFAEAESAVDYYIEKRDEDSLSEALPILKRRDRQSLLFKIIDFCKTNNIRKPLDTILGSPGYGETIQDAVLKVLVEWEDTETLVKLLDTSLADKAVEVLSKVSPDLLKERYRKEEKRFTREGLRTRIVFELGSRSDDTSFLKEALSSSSSDVRHQAAKHLAHYGHFDVLKGHAEKEKDPEVSSFIDTTIARYETGEASKYIEKIPAKEREDEIAKLIDRATKAFTRWEQYPEIRKKILGEGRYPHTETFAGWVRAQRLIDKEIEQEFDKLPSLDDGRKALDGLKLLAGKIKDKDAPSLDARIESLKSEIKQARTKASSFQQELDKEIERARQEDLTELERREEVAPPNNPYQNKLRQGISELESFIAEALSEINAAEDILEDTEKSDLPLKVELLEKMYLEAVNIEKAMRDLTGPSWKKFRTYEEYLTDTSKTPAKLVKDRSDFIWDNTAPLRKEYTKTEEKRQQQQQTLSKFYKQLQLNHPIVSAEDGEPVSFEIRELEKELKKYLELEQDWFKKAGAVAPYVEVDDAYYRLVPGTWTTPRQYQAPLLPEGHGMLLQPAKPGQVHSPYEGDIKKLQNDLQEKRSSFFKELRENLPPAGKQLLAEYQADGKKAEGILLKLYGYGIRQKGGEFVSPWDQLQHDKKAKEKYDEKRKELVKKLQDAETETFATEEGPKKLKEADPAKYLALLVEKDLFKKYPSMELFRKEYGVPPLPDTPNFEAYKQWYADRWRSPFSASKPSPMFFDDKKEPIGKAPISKEDNIDYLNDLRKVEELIIANGPPQTDLQGFSKEEYNRLLKENKPTEAAYYWWWMHFGGFTQASPPWKRAIAKAYKFRVAPPHDPVTYAEPPWQDPDTYGVSSTDEPSSRAAGAELSREKLEFKGKELGDKK